MSWLKILLLTVGFLAFGAGHIAVVDWLSNRRGCIPFTQGEVGSFCLLVGPAICGAGAIGGHVWQPFGLLLIVGFWVMCLPLMPWVWFDPKLAKWDWQGRDDKDGEQ
jgi:hypothetical protein